jgi:2-dehydro-3-deoxyphosphogluconate aldolase/(4S)-4-hydroxy-2-oxoglutarate aldolase
MDYIKLINLSQNKSSQIISIIDSIENLSKLKFNPKIIEYVFREKYNKDEIIKLKDMEKKNNFILSAGTITSIEEIDFCISNDISLLFSPHYDEKLIKYCFDKNIIMVPGVFTPTEIIRAYNNGVKIVKLFPYNFINNPKTLKSFLSVFNKLDIKFIITGGVNKDNYKDILSINNVIFVGSSSINEI